MLSRALPHRMPVRVRLVSAIAFGLSGVWADNRQWAVVIICKSFPRAFNDALVSQRLDIAVLMKHIRAEQNSIGFFKKHACFPSNAADAASSQTGTCIIRVENVSPSVNPRAGRAAKSLTLTTAPTKLQTGSAFGAWLTIRLAHRIRPPRNG
jgi:hypothetical protein